MKNSSRFKISAILFASFTILSFAACEDDDEPVIETRVVQSTDTLRVTDTLQANLMSYSATFRMEQRVNGNAVVLNTPNMPYTNAAGNTFMISRLRYLISDVAFHKADGSCFTIDDYHFVNLSDTNSLTYRPNIEVPEGDYTGISFKFGFDREDNIDGAYPDLNSASWGWPSGIGGSPNFGGGYHFMQLDGRFMDNNNVDTTFNTHMGTARNMNVSPTTYEDNHFVANPTISTLTVDGDFELTIVMNVEQWYEDPYQWDLNMYNRGIMGNYDAQRKLNLNGPSVFTVEIL